MQIHKLHAPWWFRLAWAWTKHVETPFAAQSRSIDDDRLDGLADLDESTLRDIGAPERLLAMACSRREVQARELDDLRLSAGAGTWSGRW